MRPASLSASLSFGFALLAAGSALKPTASAPASPAGAFPEPTWRSDYEAARLEARQSGKPLFVAFR
jgi:hypothetical protein